MELAVQIKGEIVSSNFAEFAEWLRDTIKRINQNLVSDEDFGQAELNVKGLKLAEDKIASGKDAALKQAEELNALFNSFDQLSDEAREARLNLERSIKAKKEEVKKSIVEEALDMIDSDRIDLSYVTRIETEIKGKRNLETIRKKAFGLAQIINMELKSSRAVIDRFVKIHGQSIAPDADQLESRSARELNIEFARRVERGKAEKEKKELEEKHKAELKKQSLKASGPEAVPPLPQTLIPHDDEPDVPAIPIPRDDLTEDEELIQYCEIIKRGFMSIKSAREALKHQANKDKALKFAQGVNILFTELKGGAK